MGETRVDLLHLLEDLRDAYPGSLEETILTEIVANSLDSGASEIVVRTDPVSRTLTVTDNGRGMSRQALSRYHDLAATSKRRGASIGFAGVGIKLGLLISEEVHTETRRVRSHLATSWRLTTKNRAPWRWIDPPGLQEGPGTTVRLYLANDDDPATVSGAPRPQLRRDPLASLSVGGALRGEWSRRGAVHELTGARAHRRPGR
jgi:DNA gyrase/topoisomerase IV subunit B